MDTNTLRYAVVGAGAVARTHLNDIARKTGVTVVGIADPADPSTWRIPSDHADVPRFSDAASLLRDTRPDLVSICTPNKFHRELTILALRAGAHVVCEKPMAMTVEEAQEMEAARVAAGRLGAINFNYRNVPAFRFARETIAAGDLGRLRRVSVVYLQSFRGVPGSPWSWRSDAAMAGFGALGDLGVHMIDGVRFVTGLEFRRVVGAAQTLIPEIRDASGATRRVTTDTNAMFLAELTGDVLTTFETTQIAPGYGDLFRIEVSGERGTLAADSEHRDQLRLYAGTALARHATWKTEMPVHQVPTAFAQQGPPASPGAIVHAIRGASTEFPTFADGLAAQRVLGAMVESMRTGAWAAVS